MLDIGARQAGSMVAQRNASYSRTLFVANSSAVNLALRMLVESESSTTLPLAPFLHEQAFLHYEVS